MPVIPTTGYGTAEGVLNAARAIVTVTVFYCNVTTAAITPLATTFNIRVIQ